MRVRIHLITLIFLMLVLPLALGKDGGRISVDLRNIETKELLKIIAKGANKSVTISDSVTGKISIALNNVSWQEALDTVLRSCSLVKYESQNIITIVTKEEQNKDEDSWLQARAFNLHHVSADNLAKILKPAGALSSRGKIGAAPDSNTLLVADTGEQLNQLDALIKRIDAPAGQIFIEARIVNADEAFLHELGLELNNRYEVRDWDKNRRQPLAIKSKEGEFNFAIARLNDSSMLDLKLAALEKDGRGRVISKPKLLATDRQPAYIEAGSEIPYQEQTREGNTSVTFKKAVLSLKVTPEIASPRAVSLLIEMSQDKIGQLLVNGVPTIDTRKIQTKVLAHDQETIVLGGIYEWSKSNHMTSIPILGKIPVLGWLFTYRSSAWERRELLIFVTPKIVVRKPS